jgi:hypothetical protein
MYRRYDRAADLPPEWDACCAGRNFYLRRALLAELEAGTDADLAYHALWRGAAVTCCFVTFHQVKDLLTLAPTRLPLVIPTTFIYLPLSASQPGIVFDDDPAELAQVVAGLPGTKVLLNADRPDRVPGMYASDYLPVCVLRNRWEGFDHYQATLRSGYRRRQLQALRRGADLEAGFLADNAAFDEELYGLYRQVFDHADYALEKLPLRYFRNSFARHLVLRLGGRPVGFVQLIEDGGLLTFAFAGFDRALNETYDLYYNLLLALTRYGLDRGCTAIDYGQTAYDCKLRFGGRLIPTYSLISSRRRALQWLAKVLTPHTGFHLPDYHFHVFKDEEAPR